MHKINQRIEDMTRLDMRTREPFQLANYGIGGFYVRHHDYFGHSFRGTGDRIATVLFYVSRCGFIDFGLRLIFSFLNAD